MLDIVHLIKMPNVVITGDRLYDVFLTIHILDLNSFLNYKKCISNKILYNLSKVNMRVNNAVKNVYHYMASELHLYAFQD